MTIAQTESYHLVKDDGSSQLSESALTGTLSDENEQQQQVHPKAVLYLSILTACIGAFHFGWLTSQLNASNYHNSDECQTAVPVDGKCVIFHGHSDTEWTFTINAWVVGGAIGALSCGIPADKFGRKSAMMGNAVVMIIGGILQAAAPSIWVFITGRFISGIASGAGTTVGTIYIGEVSPANQRGTLGGCLQMALTVGILAVTTVHFGLDNAPGWQYVTGFPVVLGSLQLLLLFFVTVESPRWLLGKNLGDKASVELNRMFPAEEVGCVMKEIQPTKKVLGAEEIINANTDEETGNPWVLIFSQKYVKQLIACVGVCAAQQLSGINAVFFYSSDIFEKAGIADARIGTEIASAVNVVACFCVVLIMDKIGRKTLLLISSSIMLLSALGLTLSLNLDISFLSIIFTALYVIGFAVGLGPIPWILVGEVFPENVRSYAGSVGTLFNWLGNLVVGISYPYIADALNDYGFVPFVATLGLIMAFVVFMVPETRNKTLEEIQLDFKVNQKGEDDVLE